MPRILSTVHLSDFQAKVLAIIKAAPTPQTAFNELSKQPPEQQNNINGAKEVLEKLGLITASENGVEITEKGTQVMHDEYLIDEMGELTDKARELLDNPSENQPELQPDQTNPDMATEPLPGEFPTESLSLLRDINTLVESMRFKKS